MNCMSPYSARMKFSRSLSIFSIIAMFLTACVGDREPDQSKDMPLVIEGWIETGEAPVVIITRAVDLTQETPSFDNFVEKWCRVSIYDNDLRYLLSGRINNGYTPSFIFTSTRLKGKLGHSYRLLVETSDSIHSAEYTSAAVIEPAPTIEEALPVAVQGDSLYKINIRLADLEEEGYYKIYTQTLGKEGRYYPAFTSTFSGDDYNESAGIDITRGIRTDFSGLQFGNDISESGNPDSETYDDDYYSDNSFSHFFEKDDIVKIKVCRISKENYDFWKAYDANVSLGNNMFFTFMENCPSNIPGALGYWGAWGQSEIAIRISPSR